MAGQHIVGSYVLGELLGRGGMGSVYAAEQPSLGRTVALKLLDPALATNPSIVERFRNEAFAGGRLSHPNVASVIDFGETREGTPFLVMELVPGEVVGTLIDKVGALSVRRACAMVRQLLSALHAAHTAGVVHADVKSDNLMVTTERDGSELVTLIDFGIARLFDRPRFHADELVVSGTPAYLAPEVIRGELPTPASDIYAAGIVLYELLTGATPFHGATSEEVLQGQLDEDVIAPSLRCPEARISAALDRAVLGALAKDPAKRHASAAAFAAALAAATPADEPSAASRSLQPAGFATETPTQDWPVAPRRRLAAGTKPRPEDRAEQLRSAIGAAIAGGDLDAIATSYLDLARALVAEHRLGPAIWELEQAVDVLTRAEGPETTAPPPALWRVLIALAAIYDGNGEPVRARNIARCARSAAVHVHSTLGCERTRALLVRLVRGVPT